MSGHGPARAARQGENRLKWPPSSGYSTCTTLTDPDQIVLIFGERVKEIPDLTGYSPLPEKETSRAEQVPRLSLPCIHVVHHCGRFSHGSAQGHGHPHVRGG